MKNANWTRWQIALIVPMLILNLQSRPIDLARARVSDLFRLGGTVACAGGLIAIHVLRSKQGARDVPPDPRAITFHSRDLPGAYWRCCLDILFHHAPILAMIYATGLILATQPSRSIARFHEGAALIAYPFLAALVVLLFIAVILVALQFQFSARFPTPHAIREETSILSAEGFRAVTPEKMLFFEWGRVAEIREHRGDLYIRSGGHVWYINRENFADREEARRFHRAAVTLWKSRGADWPVEYAPGTVLESAARPGAKPAARPAPFARDDSNPYAPPTATDEAPGLLPEGLVAGVGVVALTIPIAAALALLYHALR